MHTGTATIQPDKLEITYQCLLVYLIPNMNVSIFIKVLSKGTE